MFKLISEQLQEVDEQLAKKAEQLSMTDTSTTVQKLQHSVRDWLKETRLQRFVRDVLKLSKLAKIHSKLSKHRMARAWFKQEHDARDNHDIFGASPVVVGEHSRAKGTRSKDGKVPKQAAGSDKNTKLESQQSEPAKKLFKRKTTFKSPKQIGVHTISINFGKKGDIQGQFISDSPSPRGRELKGKNNSKVQ